MGLFASGAIAEQAVRGPLPQHEMGFCPISFIVVQWTTTALTGDGGLGFYSGEGA